MTAYSENKCRFLEIVLAKIKFICCEMILSELMKFFGTSRRVVSFFTWDLKRHMSSNDHQSMHIFPPERHVVVVTGIQSREAGDLEYSLTVMGLVNDPPDNVCSG